MAIHLPFDPHFDYQYALACPKCKPKDADLGYLHLCEIAQNGETVHLLYYCEICGEASSLCLEQHKGNTGIHWTD